MTSPRPDGATPRQIAVQTILKGFDFWIAGVVGLVTFFVLLGREDVDGANVLFTLGAIAAPLVAAVWFSERWLFDKIDNSPYGELLGAIDPDGRALFLPFAAIRYVGITATVLAVASGTVVGTLGEGVLRSLAYAVPGFLFAWTVFGVVGLMLITSKHMRRMRSIESTRLQAERERRQRRSGENST